jgi:hypothetical protein
VPFVPEGKEAREFRGRLGQRGLFSRRRWLLEPDAPSEDIDIDADITFGGFALLACQFSKIDSGVDSKELGRRVTRAKAPLLKRLGWILAARWQPEHIDKATAQLADLGFSANQRELVLGWVKHEVRFTESDPG